ncbi:uncharacterized protein [Henckelia pumila]|uniref:uncharacterized protein n=1 Tax=Henckelia pumila TaxID=405737 RepID=UPI003C6E2794
MASSTSAKYPWPSTVNVANFVTVRPQLDRSNLQRSIKGYMLWKEQMICMLESQDLLGFIDGTTPSPPPDSDNGESMGKLWRRTDRLVKGWIFGSIMHDALDAVVGLDSSMEVWLKLDNLFKIQTKTHAIINVVRNDQNGAVKDEDRIVELPESSNTNALDQGNVESRRKDMNSYLPLYKAVLKGDWNEGRQFLDKNEEGITAILNSHSETLLHAAVKTGKSNDFLRNLLERIPEDALLRTSTCGLTALHSAAVAGNTGAAIMLVNKNPKLLYILNDHNLLPVHVAAIGCHKRHFGI